MVEKKHLDEISQRPMFYYGNIMSYNITIFKQPINSWKYMQGASFKNPKFVLRGQSKLLIKKYIFILLRKCG